MAAQQIASGFFGSAGIIATAMLVGLLAAGGSQQAGAFEGTYIVEADSLQLARAFVSSVGGDIAYEGSTNMVGAVLRPNQVNALKKSSVMVRPWTASNGATPDPERAVLAF